MFKGWALALISLVGLLSCAVLDKTSQYGMKTGIYQPHLLRSHGQRVYMVSDSVTLLVYPYSHHSPVDTSHHSRLEPVVKGKQPARRHFYKPSFDLDVLTLPFKYRPPTPGFPRQLNANFNGALYAGYRTDLYKITYQPTPVGTYQRHISHYGYGLGGILGLGATPMNPWVTNNAINVEYDGLVVFAGMGAIIAVNNLSFGVSAGLDHLTDPNRQYWIYRGKPWAGVLFGFSLN